MPGIYSAHDAILGVQGAMGGGGKSRCYVELTDDPVGSDLTVTAADCITYYDNMVVPGGTTVTVETGGRLIDRGRRLNIAPRLTERVPVVLTTDDGKVDVIDLWATPSETNNCKLTIFAIGSRVGSGAPYMTTANLNTLQAAGHEIASHTYSHQILTSLTIEEKLDDMRLNIFALEALVTDPDYECLTLAYPFHLHDAETIAMAQRFYIAARNGYTADDGDPGHAPIGAGKLYSFRMYEAPCYKDFSVWTGRTAITAISGDGATVTVTAEGHPFVNGDSVIIEGTASFDGTYADITKTSADEFTYADTTAGSATPSAAYADAVEAIIRAAVDASLVSCQNTNTALIAIGHTVANSNAAGMQYICEQIDAAEWAVSMTMAELAQFIRQRTTPDETGELWTTPYNSWLVWSIEDRTDLAATIAAGAGIDGRDCVQLVNTGAEARQFYFKADRVDGEDYTASVYVKSDTGSNVAGAVALISAGATDSTTYGAPTDWTRIEFSRTAPNNSSQSVIGVDVQAGKSLYIDKFQYELGITATAWREPFPLAL